MKNNIEFINVNKSYYIDNKKIDVIKDFNLKININEITVILGKSGCGKTTLLKLIKGIENIDSGKLSKSDIKIATVFQEARLMPWLNVYDNIIFSLNKKDINKKEIDDLLNLIELDDFRNAYPNNLSGGMMARVSIARALAYNPKYILMDEPFSALDYFTREYLQKEILKIYKHKKCGILFVTHSIDEALILADKIVIMKDCNIKNIYTLPKGERNILDDLFIEYKKKIINDLKEIE